MALSKVYGKAPTSLASKTVDFLNDSIKALLTTSTYAPNLDTHQFLSSVTNELAAGNGYTTGGVALASKTITYTAANSWGTSRANSTAYALGDVVRPATGNGFLYRAVVAGTSGASIPTYPTVVGQTVADGGVTWVNIGTGITVLDAADPAWGPGANLTGIRYMVIYDDTPATAATKPLLVLVDFQADQAVTNGTFTGVLPALGLLFFTTS